jgi:hypothetical protein
MVINTSQFSRTVLDRRATDRVHRWQQHYQHHRHQCALCECVCVCACVVTRGLASGRTHHHPVSMRAVRLAHASTTASWRRAMLLTPVRPVLRRDGTYRSFWCDCVIDVAIVDHNTGKGSWVSWVTRACVSVVRQLVIIRRSNTKIISWCT